MFWWPEYNPIYWVIRKCCMSLWCMLHMLIGTKNSMVTFIFTCDPNCWQFKAPSNFQMQNFSSKSCQSHPVLNQESKSVIYFYENKRRNAKYLNLNNVKTVTLESNSSSLQLKPLPWQLPFWNFCDWAKEKYAYSTFSTCPDPKL